MLQTKLDCEVTCLSFLWRVVSSDKTRSSLGSTVSVEACLCKPF